MTRYLTPALVGALALTLLLGWCNDRQHRERLREALNDAARRDTTRLVYQDSLVKMYERLILIERQEALEKLETAEERATRGDRLLREVYAAHVNALGVIDGLTVARNVNDSTRIAIDGRDGPIRVTGEVRIAGRIEPDSARTSYSLEAAIDSLVIRLRRMEDPRTGAQTLAATSTQPQVKSIRLEGAVEVGDTSLGDEGKPSRFKAFLYGLGAGALTVCAMVCR